MKIISISAAMILATTALGQDINVVQVNIIPTSPSPTDNIKIALETGTPYLGERIGFSFLLSDDTVHITGCFLAGVAAQPKAYYDTVTIGTLPIGTYHVLYEARISDNGECDSLYSNDWGEADFQVGVLAVGEQENNWGIVVFPNPAADYQLITVNGTGDEKLQIDLLDMQGRYIRNVFRGFTSAGKMTVNSNITDLSPAPYLYRIYCGDSIKTLRFVKN